MKNFKNNNDISYNKIIGIARANWLKTSGGVKIPPKTNATSITNFLFEVKLSIDIT